MGKVAKEDRENCCETCNNKKDCVGACCNYGCKCSDDRATCPYRRENHNIRG